MKISEKIIPFSELTEEKARSGCFVTGMPNDVYHSYAGVSKSGLDLINRSPAHYRYGTKREPTSSMVLGSAIHAAILEPDWFKMKYVLLKDVNDRRKAEYKAAVSVHGAELVLIAGDADRVSGMQEVVYANSECRDLLTPLSEYATELSAFIECPETGVLMRCRYDFLAYQKGYTVDLKSSRSSAPNEFSKSVYNYRYHVQDAMYSDIYKLITGKNIDFKFLVVESDAPHVPMIYTLTDETKSIGFAEYRRNIETYAECIKNNEWPGYGETVQELSLPSWAINQYENELEITFDE